jgi:hypothetical protein
LIDLFGVAYIENMVKDLHIPSGRQTDYWAYIWFAGTSNEDAPEAYIKTPLIHFEPTDFTPIQKFLFMNYYSRAEHTAPNYQYAISPQSVPSIESLLRAHHTTKGVRYASTGPFAGLYKAIGDFVEVYCRLPGTMPLVRTA